MGIPVIFDTDAGSDIDDLWALALIVNHPDLDLIGVTTVSGDTHARARLVAKMLRLAGRDDVPVFAGMGVPVTCLDGSTPPPHGGKLSHTQFVGPDDPEMRATYGDGVDFILGTLSTSGVPVTIIGTGPWTNVAAAVRRADARCRSRIGCLALMGGEVRLNMVESNLKHDPEAARIVFESRLPVFDATWSASRQLFFTIAEVDELCSRANGAFLEALREATVMWWGKGMTNKPGPVCYDVIPVFWAAGETESISCIRLDEIPVELEGTRTRGMTVSHPWQVERAERTALASRDFIAVTDSIDANALKRRYVELVFG